VRVEEEDVASVVKMCEKQFRRSGRSRSGPLGKDSEFAAREVSCEEDTAGCQLTSLSVLN
jgi:hypothetical protein